MNTQLNPEFLFSIEAQFLGESYTTRLNYLQIKQTYGQEKADAIQRLRCGYSYFAAKEAAQNSLR